MIETANQIFSPSIHRHFTADICPLNKEVEFVHMEFRKTEAANPARSLITCRQGRQLSLHVLKIEEPVIDPVAWRKILCFPGSKAMANVKTAFSNLVRLSAIIFINVFVGHNKNFISFEHIPISGPTSSISPF